MAPQARAHLNLCGYVVGHSEVREGVARELLVRRDSHQGVRPTASHAAHCVARHDVGSHVVPVALVGEFAIAVASKVARQPRRRTASTASRTPDGASPRRSGQRIDGSTQKFAALVDHALLDDLVGSDQKGLRDRNPERGAVLRLITNSNFVGSTGRSASLAPLRILSA